MDSGKKYEAIVVGISAGGLQALSYLLSQLPGNYPIPIIIVQHRSKDERNLLEEILQTKCRLKIKQADEKEKIKKGIAYLAPPDYHLLIESNNTFSLSSEGPVSYSRPSIDVLFESAAEVYKEKLIGIILTGANRDGANGISIIKKYGGITIAQSPFEAEYSVMPSAAIDTKNVLWVMNLQEIQFFLLKQKSHE